jgi:hypothetical protein
MGRPARKREASLRALDVLDDAAVMGAQPCRSEFGARFAGPNRLIFLMTNPTATPNERAYSQRSGAAQGAPGHRSRALRAGCGPKNAF